MTVYYLLDKRENNFYKIRGTWFYVLFGVVYDICKEYDRRYEFFCVSEKIIDSEIEKIMEKYLEGKPYLVWYIFWNILKLWYEYHKHGCKTDDIFKITLSKFKGGSGELYDTFRILYRYDERLYRMDIEMKDGKIESYLVYEVIDDEVGPIKGVMTRKSPDFIDLEELRNIKTLKELHEKIVEV